MSTYDQIMDVWKHQAADARDASADRAKRVLAHPDLVARMKKPPLSMKEPDRWSGWIPPRTDPEQTCGGCRHGGTCATTQHRALINDSAFRKALVDIAAEALRRDTQPALDEIAPPAAIEAGAS